MKNSYGLSKTEELLVQKKMRLSENDDLLGQTSQGKSENDGLLAQNGKIKDRKVNAKMTSYLHKNHKV